MFRVENYILLYINEYISYIFNNLKGMPRMFPKTKMDIKNNLLKEIKKTVDIYVNDFRPSINKESVTKMKKVTDDINMNDSKHQINFYEIFLEKGKIQIQEINNCIILTICLENVIINQSFDLISYYRNKNFNSTLEAYTNNYNEYYMVLENGKILIYDRDTIIDNLRKGLPRDFVSPWNFKNTYNENEEYFFEYLKRNYNDEQEKIDRKIKIKYY